jgi:hypothetical protein
MNQVCASPKASPVDFLSLLKEGDSYGSRCRDFCFIADCPVREDSR